MGGGNPVKQIADATTKFYADTWKGAANAVGLGGVRDAIGGVENFANGVTNMATGEDKKIKAAADKKSQEASDAADADARRASVAAGEAAFQSSETQRMSAGGGARTLLTGPAGLEDDETKSISRRTLAGS